MGLPHISSAANTSWVFYNSVKLWHYWPGIRITSYRPRIQSHKTAPLQPPVLSHGISNWPAINGGSHDLLLGFSSLLEWLIELRKTCTFANLLYNKGYDKNTDGQPEEELDRMGCRRVPGAGASVPMEPDASPYQNIDACTNLQALWTLYFLDFHGGFIT